MRTGTSLRDQLDAQDVKDLAGRDSSLHEAAMERLYRTYDRKDFEILAVSTDAQGVAVTRPFQQENRLTFPILHDADFRVGLSYGARTLPMTFMVDRQGIVRQHIFGARDWEAPEAHQLIEMLMKS